MIKGIDISKWQGAVNLDAIKRDVDFAIIRAGYGGGGVDSQLVRSRDGLRSRNVPLGFYFFAYPGRGSGAKQAQEFYNIVGPLKAGEFVALDMENEPVHGRNLVASDVQWSLDFLKRAEELFGVKPMIYIDGGVKSKFNWSPVVKGDYGLWIAHWGSNNGEVTSNPDPSPWPFWALHQYTSRANMGGIYPVDANRFNGPVSDLKKYGKGSSSQPKPTPPKPGKGKKTNSQLADEVLQGAWGNGADRKKRLEAAGHDYNAVQAIVNQRVSKKPARKSNEALAAEVIAGKWGDGETRKHRLTKAGYNYDAVQAIVNKKVGGSKAPQPVYHIVRAGDTLGRLASKYGTSVKQLQAWNKSKYPSLASNADHIQRNWVLRVK